MSTELMLVLVIVVLAVVALGAFAVYQSRAKVHIKGPLGTGVSVDASNEPNPPPPGIHAEDIKSRKGGLLAQDDTGRGVVAKEVDVETDVILGSTPPKSKPDPKA